MSLYKWKEHVTLILGCEKHLHPKLKYLFKYINTKDDDYLYNTCTYNLLHSCTDVFEMLEEKRFEVLK